MTVRSRLRLLRKTILGTGAAVALTAGILIAMSGTSLAAGPLPCDSYGSAGTACVAAHSTTRALFMGTTAASIRSAASRTTRPATSAGSLAKALLNHRADLLRLSDSSRSPGRTA